jgi:phosphoglucomutase
MNYKEKAEYWLSCPGLDKNFKAIIKNMTEDELKEAFTDDLEFGTGGIRGIMGPGSARMNVYNVRKATLGFGRYLIKNVKKALSRGVAISFDNRHNSKEFANEAAHVLTSLGFEKVFVYNTLRPTPQLSWTVRHLKCAGGIMITASHNPKEYNGFKAYNEDGCQLQVEEANAVIKEINSIESLFNIKFNDSWKNVHYLYDEYDGVYLDEISKIRLNPDVEKKFLITYTPLHGTGSVYIPRFLQDMGYHVKPIIQQMTVDPDFSQAESSNPENKDAFIKSIKYGTEIGARLLLASDPDADRLGCGVLHDGHYRLLTGNEMATILFNYICENKRKKDPTWPKKGYMVSTIVSSQMASKIAKKYNIETVNVLTGFKFIAGVIKKREHKGEYVFGYEESYGCLISPCVRDKDSAQACLLLCEACAYYLAQGKDLVDVLEDLYKEYGYYKDTISNIYLEGLDGKEKIKSIMEFFRNENLKFGNFNLVSREDYLTKTGVNYKTGEKYKLTLPESNVLRYEFDNGAWFVLRPSGTEPKIKIYTEGISDSEENADKLCKDIQNAVLDIVNRL